MCDNTDFNKCMKCQKYSVNEHHGYRDKPSEEIIICGNGGTKKWQYVNHEYRYELTNDLD